MKRALTFYFFLASLLALLSTKSFAEDKNFCCVCRLDLKDVDKCYGAEEDTCSAPHCKWIPDEEERVRCLPVDEPQQYYRCLSVFEGKERHPLFDEQWAVTPGQSWECRETVFVPLDQAGRDCAGLPRRDLVPNAPSSDF